MIGALFTLIIYLLVIGLLYGLVLYVLQNVPIPEPIARIIRVAAMVIFVLIVITLLLDLIGAAHVGFPRLNLG